MSSGSEEQTSFCFGRFQVLPHRREVLADGAPLKLGGRAFDLYQPPQPLTRGPGG